MGRAIFISYRRDDSEGEAGRLFDDLVRAYGDNSVFMDVAGIAPGHDFRKAIDDNVSSCGVLLAMIGPTWATVANGSDQRRLDDENDFVRLEIASALRRDIPVIPVLVHEAKMPRPEQLPADLKDLAYRNSVEITHARWNSDVQLLTQALAQYVKATSATSTEPVHAAVPVQLPPANAPQPVTPGPAKKSQMPLMIGLAVAAVLAIVVAAAVRHFSGTAAPAQSTQGASPTTGAPTPTPAAGNPLVGVWVNSAENSQLDHNALEKLEITAEGDRVGIRAWGKCQDCDWGEKTVPFDGQQASVAFDVPTEKGEGGKGRVATLIITPLNGGLRVDIVNTFAAQKPTRRQFDFVRAQVQAQ